MDLAKPSDWRMADRSPCLVLGKSCRGGRGDDDEEVERAFTPCAAQRMVAVHVTAMESGRRSGVGVGKRMLQRFVLSACYLLGVRAWLCYV